MQSVHAFRNNILAGVLLVKRPLRSNKPGCVFPAQFQSCTSWLQEQTGRQVWAPVTSAFGSPGICGSWHLSGVSGTAEGTGLCHGWRGLVLKEKSGWGQAGPAQGEEARGQTRAGQEGGCGAAARLS